MAHLIAPHGGTLVNLLADENRAKELKTAARDSVSWPLTARQLCDLELLMNGGFSPLAGFMDRADYERVCSDMRLADDTLWPMPITLDVTEELAEQLDAGTELFLREPEGVALAVLHVEEIWRPDLEAEAEQVFATTNTEHPAVDYLLNRTNPVYVGGRIEGLQAPRHYDFVESRLTPARLRRRFAELGWRKVIAFQTRNPMHRAHFELTYRAAREHKSNLLVHPVVGKTKPEAPILDALRRAQLRLNCQRQFQNHVP